MIKCGQTLIKYRQNSSILLVYDKRRHMIWKSHDITSQNLERSTVQKSLEKSGRVWIITSRSMLTALLPHSVYMVYSQTTHGLQGRMHSRSVVIAQITCNSINRIAIQWKLLVEFSCNPHIDSLLRALLGCVIIGLCIQWLPQHIQQLGYGQLGKVTTRQRTKHMWHSPQEDTMSSY